MESEHGQTPSNQSDHKLHAVVFLINSYAKSPLPLVYRTACGHWYAALTEREKLLAIQTAQAFNSGDEEMALRMVAVLPPVPCLGEQSVWFRTD
jgi:hypothetical protein